MNENNQCFGGSKFNNTSKKFGSQFHTCLRVGNYYMNQVAAAGVQLPCDTDEIPCSIHWNKLDYKSVPKKKGTVAI